MNTLGQHVFFWLAGMVFALPSTALSPARVEGEASVTFGRGAVALTAPQRQSLVGEAARVLAQRPCKVQFGVSAYGDQGLAFGEMRSLALDRARYIQTIFKSAMLDIPVPQLYVGGDRPEEAHLLATGWITIGGFVGPLSCER